ncbi:peptidase [Candidatus Synechococcus calcipolaris G9]|uniref:Peptidase n=1 Tax=Candidatus Synechococcus calcipolaris G9 TaxID=1497997 RepID=A0ABT6EX26_9SYNE|nr:peptidase [Candidatus Synechococcus calcipolaris]MDG2990354.1 peptidase [Candidatus Synechococcus calcipolaris G9]
MGKTRTLGQKLAWFLGWGLLGLWLFLLSPWHGDVPLDMLRHSPSYPAQAAIAPRNIQWPDFARHPLPTTLADTQLWADAGDYFDEVQVVEVGYLVWSDFPIRVYLNPPDTIQRDPWLKAAQTAVEEWQAYLPLKIVEKPEGADITIQSTHTGYRSGGRVRSGETLYELWLDSKAILRHRCTVIVHPNQSPPYVLGALRHELGHALGVWGHSPVDTDALYFAQVREPPPISKRDINTLRRVYEQPTRLGWVMPNLAGDRPETSSDEP